MLDSEAVNEARPLKLGFLKADFASDPRFQVLQIE